MQNADILEDPVSGYYRQKANKERNTSDLPQSIEEYDEGWIHSYVEFANDLKTMDIPETKSDAEYDALEKKLVSDRITMLQARCDKDPSDFNSGAVDAWESYAEMHLAVYKRNNK